MTSRAGAGSPRAAAQVAGLPAPPPATPDLARDAPAGTSDRRRALRRRVALAAAGAPAAARRGGGGGAAGGRGVGGGGGAGPALAGPRRHRGEPVPAGARPRARALRAVARRARPPAPALPAVARGLVAPPAAARCAARLGRPGRRLPPRPPALCRLLRRARRAPRGAGRRPAGRRHDPRHAAVGLGGRRGLRAAGDLAAVADARRPRRLPR